MNLKKLFFVLLISILSISVFGQQDGYWDKERVTKKEIIVSARDRIVIKSEDFPVGTTEIVFRITLLDENQQLASSLVSVLKSIPDPTGISQGSAGAIFLLSKISGNDKCKYAVFSNELLVADYKKSGTTTKACFVQPEAISKDAKRLSIDKSSCLLPNLNAIWFGFESTNWIMKQKIVLEIVPWVNTKLSRGWNLENRKLVLNQCKTADLVKNNPNSEEFCVCILQELQKQYTFKEFQQLLAVEKSKVFKDFGGACFEETGASKKMYSNIRLEVSDLIQKGEYVDAISKLQIIIADGKATASDFNAFGYIYILTKQFDKAIKFLKEGEKLDESELLIKLNLAHAYLLNNNFKSAKFIHIKYQFQNVTDSLAWTQKVKLDFEKFKNAGLSDVDFNRVLRLFKD
jgi:tetratricopeptide (TPR) repeat protein